MGLLESSQFLALMVALVAGSLGLIAYLVKLVHNQRSLRQELDDLRARDVGQSSDDKLATPDSENHSDVPAKESQGTANNLLFLSYASEDKEIVDTLKVHLSPVLRKHNLDVWLDSSISHGKQWSREIQKAITASSMAIAVVSPDYLASEYAAHELSALIKAQEKSGLQLLWLPARPSAFESTELASFQGLLNPGQPLSMFTPDDREIAFVTVAETVARYLEEGETVLSEGPSGSSTRAVGQSVRLEKLRLQNIRCFRELEINFSTKSPTGEIALPSLRTVLVGDNATGKSTILRAIALGMCDESGAAALLNAMPGRMIRSGESSASIELVFRSDKSAQTIRAYTEITKSNSGSEIIRKSDEPISNVIVVGYGTQRTRAGNEGYENYDAARAVGTLFDDEARLQNPELVLLRQPRWIRMKVQEIVAGVLNLQSDEVEYRSDGVQVIGSWGQERLDVLSDGYRSTAQWILDFVSWIIYSGAATTSLQDVPAIVLFDELEQHLHPQWQRRIIERLRNYLPNVQFIITSHSPLIASSVTALQKDGWREKLYYFGAEEDGTVTATESQLLRGMSIEQVLASPAFDYLVDAEPSVTRLYREASTLASKGDKRTPAENERYMTVKRIVGEMLTIQDKWLIEQEAREDLNEQAEAKIEELELAVFGETR